MICYKSSKQNILLVTLFSSFSAVVLHLFSCDRQLYRLIYHKTLESRIFIAMGEGERGRRKGRRKGKEMRNRGELTHLRVKQRGWRKGKVEFGGMKGRRNLEDLREGGIYIVLFVKKNNKIIYGILNWLTGHCHASNDAIPQTQLGKILLLLSCVG